PRPLPARRRARRVVRRPLHQGHPVTAPDPRSQASTVAKLQPTRAENARSPVIAVVDYGIGNLHSVHKAFARLGADARLTADAGEIAAADAVVLPGVGAFGGCMRELRAHRLDGPVLDAVASGRPFLGICVGMQMLFSSSEED